MGEVFLARHQHLGSLAAIKVLRPELCTKQDAVRRFLIEARAVTAIRHPSIVEIYDFKQLADGRACIIMECLQGETLGARLARVPRMAVPVALLLARQMAGALAAAHAKGIVHRDLKPENLFLIEDPEIEGRERIKLLDFGIAKLSEKGPESPDTRAGQVLGTPGYMSPEQCRASSNIDGRSDLYSLGCVLYRMLSGRLSFECESLGDVFAHHLYFEPEPLRRVQRDVPAEVEALVHKLLAKKPEDRYSSARELVEAIDSLTRGAVARLEQPRVRMASEIPGHQQRRKPLVPSAGPASAATLLATDSVANDSVATDSVATVSAKPGTTARARRASTWEPIDAPTAMGECVSLEAPAPRVLPWVLGGAIAAAVGAGVVLSKVFMHRPAVVPQELVVAPTGASAQEEHVTIQFVVWPQQAHNYRVRFAGRLIPSRVLSVPRGHAPLQVEISAPGYHPTLVAPVPLNSMAYPVNLSPIEVLRTSVPRSLPPPRRRVSRIHRRPSMVTGSDPLPAPSFAP